MIGIGIGISPGLNGAGGGVAEGGRLVVFGDSIAAGHGMAFTPSAITLDGSTTMVVDTSAAHGLAPGADIHGFRTTREELNGRYTVATTPSTTQFTVVMASAQSGAVAARAGSFAGLHTNLLKDTGSVNWLTALNDACFDIVGVCAEPGCSADYLPTLIGHASGVTYEWAAVIAGINDIAADASAATTFGYLQTAIDALLADGKKVIVATLGPWSNSNASFTTGRYTIAKDTNTLLRAYVAATANVYLMDTMAAGTSDGDAVVANVLLDGVHPSAKGSYLFAKQFIADNVVSAPASITDLLPIDASQDILVTPAIHQCWANPMLAGTSGNRYGDAIPTGTVATSQTVYLDGATSAAACSATTDADGYGAQRVAWVPAASGNALSFYPADSVADIAAGETIRTVMRVKVGATGGGATTNLKSLHVNCTYKDSTLPSPSTTRHITSLLYSSSSTVANYPQLDDTLTFVTPQRLLSAVATATTLLPQLRMVAHAADTITVDVSRPAAWGE